MGGGSSKSASAGAAAGDVEFDNISLLGKEGSASDERSIHDSDGRLSSSLTAIISSRQLGATREDLLPISELINGDNCIASGEVEVRGDNLKWVLHDFILAGTCLYLWKNAKSANIDVETKKPTAVYQISYVTLDVFKKETLAGVSETLLPRFESDMGEGRLRIYHPRGVCFLRPTGNGPDIDSFFASFSSIITSAFSPEEIEAKREAANRLEYFLFRQCIEQYEKHSFLLDMCVSSGFLDPPDDPLLSTRKIKGGNLAVQIEDFILIEGETVETEGFYAIVLPDGMYWYRKHGDPNDESKEGELKKYVNMLNLTNCEINVNLERFEFTIATPLRSITFLAANLLDLSEWVKAVGKASTGKSNVKNVLPTVTFALWKAMSDDPVAAKNLGLKAPLTRNKKGLVEFTAHLCVRDENGGGGKTKKFTLKVGENTVGRDESNMICLDDERCSRFHMRIDVDELGQATAVDLNSSRGISLNKVKMLQFTFGPGETVGVGHTDLVF